MEDDVGGGTDSPDGVASRWIISASASVIFPCIIKSRRWQAIMKEVDKGCSKFCITVGTLTRTAGILICSQLQMLAVNLSQPAGCLWLYAGLIGSNNRRWLKADVVCVNPSSFSWVWVRECFVWYPAHPGSPGQRVVKWLRACVCVCVCLFYCLWCCAAALLLVSRWCNVAPHTSLTDTGAAGAEFAKTNTTIWGFVNIWIYYWHWYRLFTV